jgi:hypothetical protein
MTPNHKSVVNLLSVLDENIEKLRSFIESSGYSRASDDEQKLLQDQLSTMVKYSEILSARISSWEVK